METHAPCELVIELNKTMLQMAKENSEKYGELCSDVKYIRKRLDNGLADDLKASVLAQHTINETVNEKIADLNEDSWVPKLLSGGIKKAILYVLTAIILIIAGNNAVWSWLKVSIWKEMPGQQQQISHTQLKAYHVHYLKDGRTLIHADDPTMPAMIYDPVTKQSSRAPDLRTDDHVTDYQR